MNGDAPPIENEPLRDAPYRVLWSQRVEEKGCRRWRDMSGEHLVSVEPVPVAAISLVWESRHPARVPFSVRAVVLRGCAKAGETVWFRVERGSGLGGDVLFAQPSPHGGARPRAGGAALVIAARRAEAARAAENPLEVAQRYAEARLALGRWIER